MNILDPQGPIAAADKMILIDSIAIMLAIVVPTIIAILAFAWYFRQSNTRAFHWPDWE
jgi:cytochrome o ubiquinol oxidase subunit 2